LRVLDLVGRGLSKTEISRRLKIARSTVTRVIATEAAGGVATVRPQQKFDAVAVRRLFNQGVSRAAIGRRLGISPPSVLTALGVQPPIAAEQVARIRELFGNGKNKTEISQLLQIEWIDVHRVLLACQTAPPKRPRRLPQSRMLRLEEFAKALAVEIGIVRQALARGEIRGSIQLRRQILVPRSEVIRLLREPGHTNPKGNLSYTI
jgi:DNA-binding CsgD family transcriptional regulator